MPNSQAWRNKSRKPWVDPAYQFDVQGVMLVRGQTFTFVSPDGSTFTDQAILEERNIPVQKPGSAGSWVSVKTVVLVGFRSVTGQTDFRAKKNDKFKIGVETFRITGISDTIPHERVATIEATE